ncbi:hypothetical protein BN1088_1432766 [Sphingobacterium sp. PM2-P1-29]|nr:hypothetical protein BN1088_1432766 [Sphingobacterium sp. PM2-P1-29]
MNRLSHFLTLFEYSEITVKEQFDELKVILRSDIHKKLDKDDFMTGVSFVNARDKIQISFIVDEGEPIDYYSGDDPIEFLSDLESKFSIIEDEKITIIITIAKSNVKGVVSIYSYSDFFVFLKDLSIQAVFHEFNTNIKKENYLIFEYQNEETIIKTKSIWFVNIGYSGLPEKIDRTPILNRAKSSCHYNFLSKYDLLAEDFLPTTTDHNDLIDLMRRWSIILAVFFLYDITNLQDNQLDYRLNGYKSISGITDLSSIIPEKELQYYNIYNWVYSSGNYIDKLGLARNIISLHLEKVNTISLKGDPFHSIQSSYKVYEKQNIKQYIEIRNKISDQLLGFHDRANKIVENFASGFQKSAFALITFYISAIILKVLNKDKLVEIFTIDAAVLSTAFILCSVIYYFVLIWEVKAQRKRFENNYKDVKKRYTDLLDEQDINRIVNNNIEFESDIDFITAKTKIYSIMWFAFLSVFLISTWSLYFTYNPLTIKIFDLL